MKIGIICPDYPDGQKSAYAFVHVRAKLYDKSGITVKIFVISDIEKSYLLEGIPVYKNSKSQLFLRLSEFNPDVLAIHFPTYKIISFLKNIKYPQVVWLHGHEILWKFRLGPAKNRFDYIKKRLVLIPRELYQILKVRRYLPKVKYTVFVSNWMKKAAEVHSFRHYRNAVVIPNPVDTTLFPYTRPKNMTMAVSLRNFNSSKYGIETAIKAFSGVNNVQLHLYGKGNYADKYNQLIKETNSNTLLFEKSINHNDVPGLFRNYGFFLAPSRVEAQGLAMCEAMASGLPVIATNVGGIPEFVRDGIDGYLVPPDKPGQLLNAINKLISNKESFNKMSKNASENINQLCSSEKTTKMEIDLFVKASAKNNEK